MPTRTLDERMPLTGFAVFLRVLDYYQGIMFLTTNQIAQFDIAIPSRIHVAQKYEHLKPQQMESICRGFLEPLNEKGLIKDYDDIIDWLKEDAFAVKNLDGRQIRNIITSALGLARDAGKDRLEKGHLKRVFSNVKSFNQDFMVLYDRYRSSQEKMIS